MNDDTSHHSCGVFKEAWKKVSGMKRSFWAAAVVLTLVGVGGYSLLNLILIFGHAAFLPSMSVAGAFQVKGMGLLYSILAIPTALIVCYMVYHILQAIFEMFILLPMRMGLRLVALRQVSNKSISGLFIFKYMTWKYVVRFVMLQVFVVLAVGIPAGIGAGLIMAAGMHHFALLAAIAAYVFGGLCLLLSLYLTVCYTFVNLLVIDRDISAWQAMKLSYNAVSKRWFCIFGTLVWLFIVVVISMLPLFIGLIWTAPFAQNVIAILYRDMLGIEGKDPVSLCESRRV